MARVTADIWIYGFEQKLKQVWSLHEKLNSGWCDDSDLEEMDDLPKFLKSISKEELGSLIGDIEQNLVGFADAKWKIYTVHSYKGMENDYIRMASDIVMEEMNLYYVAITRGLSMIASDPLINSSTSLTEDPLSNYNFDFTLNIISKAKRKL
jgi:superfamily I DNA/RNA helicase